MLDSLSLKQKLLYALEEDMPHTDVTCETLALSDTPGFGTLIAKESGIFYGSSVLQAIALCCTPPISITGLIEDGTAFSAKDPIAHLSGNIQDLLRIERVLLNLLQHLCGISTQSHAFVQALDNPSIQILDTRKTTPLWRDLEKAAVVAGGAFNHRQSLSDMVLIKENHLALLPMQQMSSYLTQKILESKTKHPNLKIEVEVENLEQLSKLDLSLADYILFDNFSLEMLDEAILYCQHNYPHKQLEVSGNICLDNIHLYRDRAIHRISCGALTHSVVACDLSLLIKLR
ncbi:MAG: carboxylating nicotinate-nucleotide diphosphorylase [bacterium]